MSCINLTGGILKGCENNSGGILSLYITEAANIASITAIDGEVTSLTLLPDTSFHEFSFNKETCSFAENTKIDMKAGSTFFEQTVNLIIPRREKAKRNTLALLIGGQKDLVSIAKDANGLYWYLGQDSHLNVSNMESSSGTERANGSNYTITMMAMEPNQASVVAQSVIDTLV
jgi:hypothetical protein